MQSEAKAPAVLTSVRAGRRRQVIEQPYYDLIFGLQATLEVADLLTIFHSHLKRAVPHEGYRYRNPEQGIDLSVGRCCQYTCDYQLHLEQSHLGLLAFTREQPFSADDAATIEAYSCRLLFPIRNALHFRQAMELAQLDPLTGIRNRGGLSGCLQREWERARRHQRPLSVVMVDIDHFKAINDTYGHGTGDEVLQAVARTIEANIRSCDLLFRYGGEEFLVVLADTAEDGGLHLAERMRAALEKSICLPGDGLSLRVTASLGVATLAGEESKEALLKRADQALYLAKAAGRNRVVAAPALRGV